MRFFLLTTLLTTITVPLMRANVFYTYTGNPFDNDPLHFVTVMVPFYH
jgi:hypothetical protein